MKKSLIFVSLTSIIMILVLNYSFAEKIVAEHTLNQEVYDGYAVDDNNKGDIIKYKNEYSNNLLAILTWVYERTDKEAWTSNLRQSDFPDDTAEAQIVGLRRKNCLILYTDTNGNNTYANYKIHKNELKLRALHVAQTNETCRYAKNKILSTINVNGKMTLQQYSMKFKANKSRKVSGLGIVTEINAPFGKYYCDQSGTVGVGTLNIRIIKPGNSGTN